MINLSKCKPEYKNLNQIQSFSEQTYATVQLMQQACKNDEYLFQEIELLKYQANPVVRKRYAPILLDELNSWGCTISGDKVIFNNNSPSPIIIDFEDMEYVDEVNSDCAFETAIHNDNTVHKRACVPHPDNPTVDLSCGNHQGGVVDAYWYVGFDRTKNYQTRPEWVKDWKESTIPAIARAQTFKIPTGVNGKLESVDLMIHTEGSIYSMWGSPLVVQLWRTKDFHATKTYWDPATKKQKRCTPVEWEFIKYPEGYPYDALATATYQPMVTSPGWINFKFDKAVEVKEGDSYALVFLSPLSHPSHCPMIGGFTRHRGNKYPDGDAFLSENNGRTWRRYGKNAEDIANTDYKLGKYSPSDFAFQCHILTGQSNRKVGEEFFLYLKPIRSNPVKTIEINPLIVDGNPTDTTKLLVFEVSVNGKTWTPIGNDNTVSFTPDDETGEYPKVVLVRARMKSIPASGETTTTTTPSIEKFKVTLTTEAPKEFYARTHVYTPKLDPMLGASVWGRVYAPFDCEPTVEGSVEIIEGREVTEHFEVITAENLGNYVRIKDGENYCIFDDSIDADALTDENIPDRYQYLIDHPRVIDIFKQNGVYIKPYSYTNGNDTVIDMLSFKDGIQLVNYPAYPLSEVKIEPVATEARLQPFIEWVDFTVDYDTKKLNFYYEEDRYVIDDIPTGSLAVTYNPIFIKNLTNQEIGENGGLILDYFKEEIIIGDIELENRSVVLRAPAVDPIKEVLLNEEEIFEDVDFTVDYENHTLVFPEEKLHAKDTLSIVYTPNLEDTGIIIGYKAKRGNLDKQMFIEPNFIEYKV